MTAEEFSGYYNLLNTRVAANDKKTTSSDFLEDLCSNLCLMYFEGDRYHFTHRSFQEYFCALFFSKQKDKFIVKLGDFFERHQRRMYGDRTFYMLYDMITEKVEEYIFLPFLTLLFDKCEKAEGYWTFLEKMYPNITYISENKTRIRHARLLEPSSFIFSIIIEKSGFNWVDDFLPELPYYEPLKLERLTRVRREDIIINHQFEKIIPEKQEDDVIYLCRCNVAEIRQHPEDYSELLKELNDDNFVFKKLFHAIEHYMIELDTKHKKENKNLRKLLKSIC